MTEEQLDLLRYLIKQEIDAAIWTWDVLKLIHK